jgi:hypothetical protein
MLNMKKIVKLTESDLIRIVKRVITETTEGFVKGTRGIETEVFLNVLKKYIAISPDKKVVIDPIINSTPLEVKWKDRQLIKDAFGEVESWCHNNTDDICNDVFNYTAGDQSTIVNLIP